MSALPITSIAQITIRPMLDQDLPEVRAIDQISFTMPWPASAYDYELHENAGSLLWVAEDSRPNGIRKIVGMVVVWLIVDEAHIATIAVLPEYRGQGIATELLKTALTEVIRVGFTIATLEVRINNIFAQNLYRRFGFEIVGARPRYYRDNNEDALIMTVKGLDSEYLEWMEKSIIRPGSGEPL